MSYIDNKFKYLFLLVRFIFWNIYNRSANKYINRFILKR